MNNQKTMLNRSVADRFLFYLLIGVILVGCGSRPNPEEVISYFKTTGETFRVTAVTEELHEVAASYYTVEYVDAGGAANVSTLLYFPEEERWLILPEQTAEPLDNLVGEETSGVDIH